MRDWSAHPAATALLCRRALLQRRSVGDTDLRADHVSSDPKPIPKPHPGAYAGSYHTFPISSPDHHDNDDVHYRNDFDVQGDL